MEMLESEAKYSATQYVSNMLQSPGQLEKVDCYKRKVSHKNVYVKAILLKAIQDQLDGVYVGLDHLHATLTDVQDIKQSLQSVQETFSSLPTLDLRLQELQNMSMSHSQYLTALECLTYIVSVPEGIQKMKHWLNTGKLLHAHQGLMNLESTRDEWLYLLYQQPNRSNADMVMLQTYFVDVQMVSHCLEKQLRLLLLRTLNTIRKEPAIIVTALRIIEREERADSFAMQTMLRSGFQPPGRPKQWRDMAMTVLEDLVSQRIEGTQVDDRTGNKMWLVCHLELLRQLILEDLIVVKSLCGPCFPPCYDIVNRLVAMYHMCLCKHLEEVISNGLEGNEYVSMLSWSLNTYPGMELMRHPELGISNVQTLLRIDLINEMQQEYLKTVEVNYIDWMQKMLETEQCDWTNVPDCDQNGYYHTSTPVIIFQMIDQNIQVSKTISMELAFLVFLLSLQQVTWYGKHYRDAVIELKKRHFVDRNQYSFFTCHMIAVLNNCTSFIELAQEMNTKLHFSGSADELSELCRVFWDLRDEGAQVLLQEATLDIEPHLHYLMMTKWVNNSTLVDTICATLDDYFHDYTHLCECNFRHVISEAKQLVALRYIAEMLSGKRCFGTYGERRNAALQLLKEGEKLESFFSRIVGGASQACSPFEAIHLLAEVLKSEDTEILSLDLHSLLSKYPDLSDDHLTRLLDLRGDLSRLEIREKVALARRLNPFRQHIASARSIFHRIP